MATSNKPAVIVTGAGGELAHHVMKKLSKQYQLIGVDFRSKSHYDDKLVQYRLDFSKRGFEDVFKEHPVEGVIHLGRIRLSESNRFRRYNTNVLGTQNLLDLSRKYKVKKVMVLSTFHVYGASAYNPALINEDFPLKASNLSAELVDTVELENLCGIYMFRYPELNLSVLRPCYVVGPGIQNAMSRQLQRRVSACLMGFSPLMQFIHVDDLAEAIALSFPDAAPGVYNVAPEDWVPYTQALEMSGCTPFPIPSIPPALPKALLSVANVWDFPAHLLNYYKYPVILDGTRFSERFGFKPHYSLAQMFRYYRELKQG